MVSDPVALRLNATYTCSATESDIVTFDHSSNDWGSLCHQKTNPTHPSIQNQRSRKKKKEEKKTFALYVQNWYYVP